jgi:hypothetical protein
MMLHPTNGHSIQHQQTHKNSALLHLLGSLCISKVLMIRNALRDILRISLHANKAVDIRESRLDNAIVVGDVGELRVEELVHLLAGSSSVVRLRRLVDLGR